MVAPDSAEQEQPATVAEMGKTVLDDLRRGDIKRSVRRDLQDLYDFYLDEERRAELDGMRRSRRYFQMTGWLAKSLFLNLVPVRRLLLLLAIVMLLYGIVYARGEEPGVGLSLLLFGSLVQLTVLMLELKDKLLARDELAVGRTVQLALLPDRDPEMPGWDISLFTRPANEVGGDLVDYLSLGDDRLGVTLGDVSGKGLGAALLMAKLQATLRALATDCASLAELGARTNYILNRDAVRGRFATLIYILVQSTAGELRVLNAGHLPPIVLQGATRTKMTPVAPPLGVARDVVYTEQRIELAPGDTMIVYSDGLTEACNEQGEFFGEERLWDLLPALGGMSAAAVGAQLLAAVDGFVGDQRPSDDLSLAVLRRL